MNERTYEMYNEDDYFMKYLSIHPYLVFSAKLHDIKKREYQTYLLDLFNMEKIDYDELCNKYKIIQRVELSNAHMINVIKADTKKQIEKLENIQNQELINLCNSLMK